jgi:hypothetical protein
MREGAPRDRVPDTATQCAQFEPVAWWWTRNQIGRDLRELYDVPKDLPPELLTLVRKLDDSDWLFPLLAGKTTEISFHSHDRTRRKGPVVVKGPDGDP